MSNMASQIFETFVKKPKMCSIMKRVDKVSER